MKTNIQSQISSYCKDCEIKIMMMIEEDKKQIYWSIREQTERIDAFHSYDFELKTTRERRYREIDVLDQFWTVLELILAWINEQ